MNTPRHPEVELSVEEARQMLSRKSRRGFLIGGVAAVATVAGYQWATGAKAEDGVPWPERRILDANAKLFRAYLSKQRLVPEFPRSRVGGVKPNGDVGLKAPLDRAAWSLDVIAASDKKSTVTLAEIRSLPQTEMTTQFCCIEGWSGISHWTGVRFADFTKHFFGTSTFSIPYVSMSTADEEYYVGLDAKSAMHPQTLLAYEQNGMPLEDRRGAPLRLVIPVKYGIKNIKRIGQIKYTAEKPDDYWAEEGYDWFAGL